MFIGHVLVESMPHIFRCMRGASVEVCIVGNHSVLEAWMYLSLYSTWSI